jgi:hypothetical protein
LTLLLFFGRIEIEWGKIMQVLSIDIDYIMGPSIDLYQGLWWEPNSTCRWEKLYDSTDFKESHFNIDQGNLIFCYEVFLRSIKNCDNVAFAYDHDSILYHISDYENIDLINIDHHDDVVCEDSFYDDYVKKLEYEYHAVKDCDRIHEGNWVSWLQHKGKLNSYTWVCNENSNRNLNEKEDYISSIIKNYNRTIRQDCKFINYNFDHIFVCLSPQYIPKSHWHYFTMFMIAYEEYTGKKIDIKQWENKKFENEYRHLKVTEEILYGNK